MNIQKEKLSKAIDPSLITLKNMSTLISLSFTLKAEINNVSLYNYLQQEITYELNMKISFRKRQKT